MLKTEPRKTHKRFLKNMSNIISWEENTWPKPRSLHHLLPPSGNQKTILTHDQMVKTMLIFQSGTRIHFQIKSNCLGGSLHLVAPHPPSLLSLMLFSMWLCSSSNKADWFIFILWLWVWSWDLFWPIEWGRVNSAPIASVGNVMCFYFLSGAPDIAIRRLCLG